MLKKQMLFEQWDSIDVNHKYILQGYSYYPRGICLQGTQARLKYQSSLSVHWKQYVYILYETSTM